MTIWAAILLGLIQGISEFLPISSSGHLSVLQNLFGMSTAENGHLFFDVLLHFGTLISICVVFEVKALAGGKGTRKGANTRNLSAARLFLMLIIGTLPLFLVLPINDYVERLYYQTFFIGAAFILTGCLLFVADKMQPGDRGEKSMRVRDALVIGLCQAIATIPGLTSSGTTISAGIATGLDRDFAVKYSFLLSLPAVLGANVLGIAKAAKEGIEISLIPVYLIGMAVAMITGIFAIGLVKRLASKGKFGYFAYYCWGAGIITMILSLIF